MLLPLVRKSKNMKCLLSQLSPLKISNFNYPNQILKPNFLLPSPTVSRSLNSRPPLVLLCRTIWTDCSLFLVVNQGFWNWSSAINRREYCSSSITGVKSMASAKIVNDPDSISYLNQREAAEIDEILMGPLGFSVDQLMVCFSFFNNCVFLCFRLELLSSYGSKFGL